MRIYGSFTGRCRSLSAKHTFTNSAARERAVSAMAVRETGQHGPFHFFSSFLDHLLHWNHDESPRVQSHGRSPSSASIFGKGIFGDFEDMDMGFEESDLMESSTTSTSLLLNKYSVSELDRLLGHYGVRQKLSSLGIDQAYVDIDTTDSFVHKFYIWMGPRSQGDKDESHLLVEMVFRRVRAVEGLRATQRVISYAQAKEEGTLLGRTDSLAETEKQLGLLLLGAPVVKQLTGLADPDFIIIEWTRMQNPSPLAYLHAKYQGPELLPGQEYPPLGIGKLMERAISELAVASKRDALVNVPLYFHNAFFYKRLGYKFVNPVLEGVFDTLVSDLEGYVQQEGIHLVAQAVVCGRLKARVLRSSRLERWTQASSRVNEDSTQPGSPDKSFVETKVVKWKGDDMVLPLSDRMQAYFSSKTYLDVAERFHKHGVFYIDPEVGVLTEEDWSQAVDLRHVDTSFRRGQEGGIVVEAHCTGCGGLGATC